MSTFGVKAFVARGSRIKRVCPHAHAIDHDCVCLCPRMFATVERSRAIGRRECKPEDKVDLTAAIPHPHLISEDEQTLHKVRLSLGIPRNSLSGACSGNSRDHAADDVTRMTRMTSDRSPRGRCRPCHHVMPTLNSGIQPYIYAGHSSHDWSPSLPALPARPKPQTRDNMPVHQGFKSGNSTGINNSDPQGTKQGQQHVSSSHKQHVSMTA